MDYKDLLKDYYTKIDINKLKNKDLIDDSFKNFVNKKTFNDDNYFKDKDFITNIVEQEKKEREIFERELEILLEDEKEFLTEEEYQAVLEMERAEQKKSFTNNINDLEKKIRNNKFVQEILKTLK